ncbi:6-phosphogluconolactonase [Halomicronema hongdechloris C2206]|uniref:6-phosphogluconolactonase n=1 Tax=Halomicronema hongdechloris C2206 TaxID=1641165 RepID=A0A1Z3HQ47_9CYAN|nr:6-phosphogluconolactonase [Halomicronema hongdechloris]ASC72366.1 6-phosphogluconolactonase [Halomicronema hongdechloris C2206]
MTAPHIEVLPDKAALVERALTLSVQLIQDAIAQRGRCTLALAGGSTPKPLYEALAQTNLPWSFLHIFWGDERYVPIDHPDSNAGMAKTAWLERVPIPPQQIHPVPTAAGDPAADAHQYEQSLRSVFPDADVPTFDLIFLGMGDDGHTASLFPHTEALQVRDRLVTVGHKDGQPRITFTVPLINQARTVLFLVAGANKQHALSQVFAEEGDAQMFPSRLIHSQSLWWLLDHGAGQALLPR